MSQAHLAARLQLKRTSVSNVECGRQRASLELVYGAASALGIHPAALLPDPDAVTFKGKEAARVRQAPGGKLTEDDVRSVIAFVESQRSRSR